MHLHCLASMFIAIFLSVVLSSYLERLVTILRVHSFRHYAFSKITVSICQESLLRNVIAISQSRNEKRFNNKRRVKWFQLLRKQMLTKNMTIASVLKPK